MPSRIHTLSNTMKVTSWAMSGLLFVLSLTSAWFDVMGILFPPKGIAISVYRSKANPRTLYTEYLNNSKSTLLGIEVLLLSNPVKRARAVQMGNTLVDVDSEALTLLNGLKSGESVAIIFEMESAPLDFDIRVIFETDSTSWKEQEMLRKIRMAISYAIAVFILGIFVAPPFTSSLRPRFIGYDNGQN